MINNDCYSFELYKHNYNHGIFDSFIDCTYIITIPGSKRIQNIKNQLEKYILTKKIYILYNKTYKKCKKILKIYLPPYDLKDAYFTVMKHSVNQKHNNIIILEDDFILTPDIKNPFIIDEIKYNMNIHKNIPYYYNLGPLPLLFYPNFNLTHNSHYGLFSVGSSAVIYNQLIQKDILKKENTTVKHWDFFLSLYYTNSFYNIPLSYQIYEETENQSFWACDNINNYVCQNFNNIIVNFLKLFNLDKNSKDGHDSFYYFIFCVHYILLLLIFFILIFFYGNIINNI